MQAKAFDSQLVEVLTGDPPRPRSRAGLVDLTEWRTARIAARALRLVLENPPWLGDIRIQLAARRGLELCVEVHAEPATAQAHIPAQVGGVPVRMSPVARKRRSRAR